MTARETAQEQALNLKPEASKLRQDITEFLDGDRKTLGQAKSYLEQLKSMWTMLNSLLPHGIILDTTNVGINNNDLNSFHCELTNFISSEEANNRTRENDQRL